MGACGGRTSLEVSSDAGQSADGAGSDDATSDVGTSTDAGIDGTPTRDGGIDSSALDSSFDGPITDAAPDGPTDAPNVLTAPRPIAPLSTSTTTSQRPTLRWQLDPRSDGAQVEICRDRACTKVVTTFTAPGNSARPPSALAAGVYFWRLHGTASGAVRSGMSPTWEFVVGARNAPVDTSWGSIPDIDGDGFADAFTSLFSSTYSGPGVVFTYHGSAQGLTAGTAFGPPSGTTAAVFFGVKTAMAGDVDGDGYPELLVSDQYRVWMYPGSASGLVGNPTLVFDDMALVVGLVDLGDTNADGYADFALGIVTNTNHAVVVYMGGPSGPSAPTTLAVPGAASQGLYPIGTDINGDGYGDLVEEGCMPGPQFDCEAYVFAGGPTGLPLTPVAGQSVVGQRTGVTFAGDVNGDGYADLVDAVPDPSNPDASMDTVIRVFPGGPAGIGAPVLFARPTAGGVTYYDTLFTAGDINGDGYADIGVGVAGGSTTDVWVYYGSAGLGVQVYGQTEVYNPGAKTELTLFSAAGDVNGDGYNDVLGGDWQSTNSSYVFLGGNNGLTFATSNSTLEGGGSVL
jgi:hypothetical protein